MARDAAMQTSLEPDSCSLCGVDVCAAQCQGAAVRCKEGRHRLRLSAEPLPGLPGPTEPSLPRRAIEFPMAHRETREYWPLIALLTIALLVGTLAIWGAIKISALESYEQAWTADQVKEWFTYEFAEVKGICQQFLTVVIGALVLSITFSEKVVRYDAAPPSQRFFLKASWCCCGLAIIGGGASLVLIMLAGAFVRYPGNGNHQVAQRFSFLVLGLSGLIFVVGLVCLLASALRGSAPGHMPILPVVDRNSRQRPPNNRTNRYVRSGSFKITS